MKDKDKKSNVINVCFDPKKQTEADNIEFSIDDLEFLFDDIEKKFRSMYKEEYREFLESLGMSEFEIAAEMKRLYGSI